MRAWPVARSIFDAPLCERSERADNRLDKAPANKLRLFCLGSPGFVVKATSEGNVERSRAQPGNAFFAPPGPRSEKGEATKEACVIIMIYIV